MSTKCFTNKVLLEFKENLAWRCHTQISQNVSLILLHWAVIMGRVSTKPRQKMPLHSIGSTNALITVLCFSFKMNTLSTSSITDAMAESTHLNHPAAAILCCKQIQPKHTLVIWMITLRLIICPSSYKTHPDNLIGPNSFGSGILASQRIKSRPNFPTSNVVGGLSSG